MNRFAVSDNHGLSFHIRSEVIISRLILLDSQSTVNISSNRFLLTIIREVERYMNIRRNIGTYRTTLVGDIQGYPNLSGTIPRSSPTSSPWIGWKISPITNGKVK